MRKVTALIVNDEDLECKDKKEKTLEELNLASLTFNFKDLKQFDLIVYSGKKGRKILKCREI